MMFMELEDLNGPEARIGNYLLEQNKKPDNTIILVA